MASETEFVTRIQADRRSRRGRLHYLVAVTSAAELAYMWTAIPLALQANGNPQLQTSLSITNRRIRLAGNITIDFYQEGPFLSQLDGLNLHGVWFTGRVWPVVRDHYAMALVFHKGWSLQ